MKYKKDTFLKRPGKSRQRTTLRNDGKREMGVCSENVTDDPEHHAAVQLTGFRSEAQNRGVTFEIFDH